MTPFHEAFQKAVDEHAELQIALAFAGPMGPGPLKCVSFGVYTITVASLYGAPPHQRPVSLPITFSVESLLWFSPGPPDADEQPMVITPGGGRGGLIVPGRG